MTESDVWYFDNNNDCVLEEQVALPEDMCAPSPREALSYQILSDPWHSGVP